MLKSIIAGVIAAIVAMFAVSVYLAKKSEKNAEKFLLPEGSDKESFTDPKTGKVYDKQAYCDNLRAYVKNLNNKQLQSVYDARQARADIWNRLLADAAHEELLRRANAAPEEEQNEAAAEEISEEIEPFFWVEQNIGASIGLSCGEYLQELFEENGMEGNGSDWDQLARAFLSEYPRMRSVVQFDSQEDMFCAYARDEQVLRQFAYKFHAACEDEETAAKLFARLNK